MDADLPSFHAGIGRPAHLIFSSTENDLVEATSYKDGQIQKARRREMSLPRTHRNTVLSVEEIRQELLRRRPDLNPNGQEFLSAVAALQARQNRNASVRAGSPAEPPDRSSEQSRRRMSEIRQRRDMVQEGPESRRVAGNLEFQRIASQRVPSHIPQSESTGSLNELIEQNNRLQQIMDESAEDAPAVGPMASSSRRPSAPPLSRELTPNTSDFMQAIGNRARNRRRNDQNLWVPDSRAIEDTDPVPPYDAVPNPSSEAQLSPSHQNLLNQGEVTRSLRSPERPTRQPRNDGRRR